MNSAYATSLKTSGTALEEYLRDHINEKEFPNMQKYDIDLHELTRQIAARRAILRGTESQNVSSKESDFEPIVR